MKIIFLTHDFKTPSVRWTLLNLIPYFERQDVNCQVYEIPDNWFKRLHLFKRCREFDIVFWHKKLLSNFWGRILRKNAKKLIYYFDDAIFFKIKGIDVMRSPTRMKKFMLAIKNVDFVICANDYLAENAKKFTDQQRIKVIPTPVEVERWKLKRYAKDQQKICIGFIGSASTIPYLNITRQPLYEILQKYPDCFFKVVSEQKVDLGIVKVHHKPYSVEDEPDDVASFDIAVSPLIETPWTMGKRPTKILSYFASGVPVVASDVYCNRLYIKDGENGFLAQGADEWYKKLEMLILDAELREKIGLAGRETAQSQYSMQKIIPLYLEIFEQLVNMD